MTLLKRLPLGSLSLLFLAHCTFSWFLTGSKTSALVWIFTTLLDFMVFGFLTAPSTGQRGRFLRKIGSWIPLQGRIISVVAVAFSVAFILFLVRIFAYVVVLIISAILARLDMQLARFGELQTFFILVSVSLSGLGFGWYMRFLF